MVTHVRSVILNAITALAHTVSGEKDQCMHAPENSLFSGPTAHLLSMLCVLVKIFSNAGVKKKTKRPKGFKFGTFWVIFK